MTLMGWQSNLTTPLFMKYKLTKIKYIDSAVADSERFADENFDCYFFEAVGFLIKETDEALVLAREVVKYNGAEKVRGVLTIPKVAILSRKEVK